MNILLVLLLIQGSILALLLYTRKYNLLQNRLLAAFIMVVVIFSSIELLVLQYPSTMKGFWFFPSVCSKLLAPALLFFYASSISHKKYVVPYIQLLIPIIIGFAFSAWYYYYIDNYNYDVFTNSEYGTILSALNLTLWMIYLPLAYKTIRKAKNEKSISSQYQSLLNILFIIIVISLFLEILDDINDWISFLPEIEFFDIVDLLFLGMIYFVSYKALSQPHMFHDIEKLRPKIEPAERYAGSKLSNVKLKGIQNNLEQTMLEEKLYLKGDLNLQELADKLQVSRQYLTQVINEKMNCNFNDYINAFRVEEFKKRARLDTAKQYTILALALDSGFNSKTTFNTIFKKHTGLTPSQFRNQSENN